MMRFSLVNPQTQNQFHNDSQFNMSDSNQLDELQRVPQSNNGGSVYEKPVKDPRERIS